MSVLSPVDIISIHCSGYKAFIHSLAIDCFVYQESTLIMQLMVQNRMDGCNYQISLLSWLGRDCMDMQKGKIE